MPSKIVFEGRRFQAAEVCVHVEQRIEEEQFRHILAYLDGRTDHRFKSWAEHFAFTGVADCKGLLRYLNKMGLRYSVELRLIPQV